MIVLGVGLFFWFSLDKLLPAIAIAPAEKIKISKTEKLASEISQFGLKIEKIDVLAPVLENVDGTKKSAYNKALQSGVAHYKGTALPGQGSNIFIFGHSSTILGIGPYAKIFARLGELKKGDKISVYYKDKEYRYTVFAKQIVEKTAVSVLLPTKKEQLTLMTCWPIGTNDKRIIIKASLDLTK